MTAGKFAVSANRWRRAPRVKRLLSRRLTKFELDIDDFFVAIILFNYAGCILIEHKHAADKQSRPDRA